jgi:hypothetical protein
MDSVSRNRSIYETASRFNIPKGHSASIMCTEWADLLDNIAKLREGIAITKVKTVLGEVGLICTE